MGPRVDESYLHPLFKNGGIDLSEPQIRDVTQFVKTGLLDPRAKKENLCDLIPKLVPSKLTVLTFEACQDKPDKKDTGLTTAPPGIGDRRCTAELPNP